jgi:hypothetical protein
VAPLRLFTGAGYRALRGGFFDGVSTYDGGGVQGTHQGVLQPVRSSGAGHAVVRLKLQPLATVAGSSKGQLTTRLGKTGVVKCVDHRHWIDRAWEAAHAAR